MSEPTIHEVSKELATLRERMNTHQAKYESALDRLRADMAKRDADAEKRDADAAQREIIRLRWQIGIYIGGVLVTIAALGIFIRLAI